MPLPGLRVPAEPWPVTKNFEESRALAYLRNCRTVYAGEVSAMLDTATRAARINARTRARRRSQANRNISLLASSCAVLTVCLIGLTTSFTSSSTGDVVGLYGAFLMFNEAGGYVFVGLVSFVVGACVTLALVSYRRKSAGRNEGGDEEKDVDHV